MNVEYSMIWVETPEALDRASEKLAAGEVVALDTEFFRESSFFPVPALIQMTAGDEVYLVDPQAVAATPALRRLLSGGAPKLMHACSEDLDVLTLWAGVDVAPLVDTQVAESLLGRETAIGYRRLVQERIGVDLPKEETRSNWLERPLTPAQCDYAALDVVFLPELWRQQRAALETAGRLAWLEEECHDLATSGEPDHARWYLRQRQLWRLSPRQIEAYRRLTIWREETVRERDKPRGWLAKDGMLFAIAEAMPKNRYELAAVDGVTPPMVKRDGDALLAQVKAALHQASETLPLAPPAPTLAPFKRRLKALKAVVQAQADALDLAPERLANRSEMEAVARAHLHGEALPLPGGWRGERLSERWRQCLADLADDVSAGDRHRESAS